MVPPYSDRISRVPPYSISLIMMMSVTGLSPFIASTFQSSSPVIIKSLRANPISLAATFGISVDFSSSGYLDVSVPPVCLLLLCIHNKILTYVSGFPHSEIPDSKGFYYLIWGLSQVNTSFIASDCQGIHRVRLVT